MDRPDNRRRAELAAIHVAKAQLGLDDPTYRAIVERVSAKFRRDPVSSSAQLDSRERTALIEELRAHGFRRVTPRSAPAPGSLQESKIRAIWQALADAGALKDSSEKALLKFVRRVAHRDALAWLTADDANKVIEGLKAWHARHAASLSQSPEAGQS
jgi:phage gp16-like protein